MKNKFLKILVVVLVVALMGVYATSCVTLSDGDSDTSVADASFKFEENKDTIFSQLRRQSISDANKDLLKKVESTKLTGEVNVIITLSTGSLVGQYNLYGKGRELGEYLSSAESMQVAKQARERQNILEMQLVGEGLISPAKYHYSTILDGFSATTTYENLETLMRHDGVSDIIISNTYLPAVAVTNDVNVYDTGIFNSNDSTYTGKGTIVAVLDTGCDYAHPAFTTHEVADPLYDRDDIARMLPNTVAYEQQGGNLEAREVYYGNLTKNKIAFGYDYADNDADIMPFSSEHGTHVAGIIGGYADETIASKNDEFTGSADTKLRGVAIDTQFAIMKVFSDKTEGAEDVDILAALEDCVNLNVDAINMSLGTSCGFTTEQNEKDKNHVYEQIEEAGISLVAAASNDYSSAFGSEDSNTNKVSNPDSGTVGAPSTYTAALSVASINGNLDHYMIANGGEREIFFLEAVDQNSKAYSFFDKIGVGDTDMELEYVAIPGYGSNVNYSGLNVEGKIALVKRGDINFEDKVLYATAHGAKGIIIYNNVYGDINMTVGNDVTIGVCSIGKDDGDYLASKEKGTLVLNRSNQAGPFMSDFSSWGPTPDLKLKPEITAHGGNIWSAVPGGGYEKLSGTSMATPNMCGLIILIRQYVKDSYPDLSQTEVRDLVNQLCMSTATIANDKNGNPYSPRKQGAGIADLLKATTTKAYLYVDGINKTKLELGDDARRTGVYTMTFKLRNLSNDTLKYTLDDLTMTESLSADKKYVAEMAYMLNNETEFSVSGATYNKKKHIVTVEGNATAEITATVKLSKQDKAYLNDSFPNGMYVEGFITLKSEDGGVDLNVPYLAFYGDWSEAPIFDLDFYLVETEAHNNAIDYDDKIKADYFATTPYALYFYDYIIPMGTFLYNVPSGYDPIPATEEHASLSYYKTSLSGIYAVYAGLLRGAKELTVEIIDTASGETVWSSVKTDCYKAHYNSGVAMPYVSELEVEMIDSLTYKPFGTNNTHYQVNFKAELDWENGERNVSDTYSFSFYIDYEAPTIQGATFRTEYNKSTKETEYYVDLEVYDNHYAMAVRPIIVNYEMDENGNIVTNTDGVNQLTLSSLTDGVIPVYQETRGSVTKVSVNITDYLDNVRDSLMPDGLLFEIDDYALNMNVCYVPFPDVDNGDMDFDKDHKNLSLDIGDVQDVSQYIESTNPNREINKDYLFGLEWKSDNEEVARVNIGFNSDKKLAAIVEGVSEGTANISFTSNGVEKKMIVTVSGNTSDASDSSGKVQLDDIEFTSYLTEFAFNGDIDYSEIGQAGDVGYFGSYPYISCYPTEKVQLHYLIKPLNLFNNPATFKVDENGNYLDSENNIIADKQSDGTYKYKEGKSEKDRVKVSGRYELTWSTNDPRVATVDQEGHVTAVAEGSCAIFLRIKVDGRTSTLEARCDITVKSEFIIESRQLVAYKGKGGVVDIPDDEGLMYIGSFAFSHFDLDNSLPDDDDDNDIDDKKSPLGNDTVTKVIIPYGVTTIDKYAFYNCNELTEVVLPDTCNTINDLAFWGCEKLEKINLDDVDKISDLAFYGDASLKDVGVKKLAQPYAIGVWAFKDCTSLKELVLTNLRRGGTEAFAGCTGLTSLTLGNNTRLSEKMFYGCSGITNEANNPLKIYSDVAPADVFYGCSGIKSVEFMIDVTYLGAGAFQNCTSLASVKFDGDSETFAGSVFAGCSALNNIESSKYQLKDCIWYDGTTLKLVTPNANLSGEYTLPDDVTAIADGAFSGCNITSFKTTDKSKLTEIGSNAFFGCGSLNSVTLPKTLKTIGDGAFGGTGISTLDIGKTSVTSIGAEAFKECKSLTKVTLPDSCTTIGNSAFEGCRQLSEINLQHVTSVGQMAFMLTALTEVNLTAENVTIAYGAFAGDLKNDDLDAKITQLQSKIAKITLGKGAHVGDYAFAYNKAINLTLTAGDIVIDGEFAFTGSTLLTRAELSGVVGRLGDYAFAQCVALQEIKIPHVTETGEGTFMLCNSLKTVETSDLTKVGTATFAPIQYDENTVVPVPLQTIDLSNVTEIGDSAFMYTSLNKVDLGSVVSIGEQAFYGVENLRSVTAPELEILGDAAFVNCSDLATFRAPKLKTIGEMALAYTNIKSFNITDSLETIKFNQYNAFAGSLNITQFTIDGSPDAENDRFLVAQGVLYGKLPNGGYDLIAYPAGKTGENYTVLDSTGDQTGTVRIQPFAFYGNKNLRTVTLPMSLEVIGDHAFDDCSKLYKVIFRSYYAPQLLGSYTVDDKITEANRPKYPGYDKLYKYDFYSNLPDGGAVSLEYNNLLSYSNFIGLATSSSRDLAADIPSNNEGYDSPLYKVFFTSFTQGAATMGRYAISFIKAVKALPATVDRYATDEVETAITAWNMLEANSDEKTYVDDSYITTYKAAVVSYHVDTVRNYINKLYDMDATAYSYNALRRAQQGYDSLTDEEKAQISSEQVAILTQKTKDLKKAMDVSKLDFSKEFADYDLGSATRLTLIVVFSVVGGLLVLAAVALGVTLPMLKKRKKALADAQSTDGAEVEEESDEN